MAAESKVSTDHEEIRRWAEERGGQPACVKGTGTEGDVGMLRIDFPGFSGEDSLQHISWDAWFEKFDERGLALLHQQMTAGGAQSNFNKLITREPDAPAKPVRKRPTAKKAGGKKVAAKGKKAVAKKAAAVKKPAARKAAKRPAVKKTAAKRRGR